jgi:hypothetical protein
MSQQRPSLVEFERHVATRNNAAAIDEALYILNMLNGTMGQTEQIDMGSVDSDMTWRDRQVRFATRFTAAYGGLLSQPDIQISAVAVEQLFVRHRWVDAMFKISGFQSSAHLLSLMAGADGAEWRLEGANLLRFLLVYSPSSTLQIDFEACLKSNPGGTTLAVLGYLSARVCATERAGAFRERMLEWLPGRFDNVALGALSLQFIAEPYMHCSYASSPRKHQIKADLIAQVRRVLLQQGAPEYAPAPDKPRRKRPRIVVVTEHFSPGHSVHRTHSRSVKALKERFEVIGVWMGQQISPEIADCFHEVITYSHTDIISDAAKLAKAIVEREPDVVFHLGVGMYGQVIALSSLRLAPIQCCSFGHTATTMSPVIDYMILPEDFIGSKDCFSEQLLLVPPSAMPYAPRPDLTSAAPHQSAEDDGDGPLRIAIPASVMKLNATFLGALRQIATASKRPVEFHFFPLACVGVTQVYLDQEIGRIVEGAVVHRDSPHAVYLERLARCAFFLCPFPYGNMNSIVDAVALGLPGVCLDGPEAHTHADVAIFKRLGLPDALATDTMDAYVAAAVRLIDDPKWRAKCQKVARDCDLQARFFSGDPKQFADAVYGLVEATQAVETV